MRKSTKTKLVGVTLHRDVVEEIKRITPLIGAETLSEAYRKIILSWLHVQGFDMPKEAFVKRQSRGPLSPEARKSALKNLKLADKANPKKNPSLKTTKKNVPSKSKRPRS